MVYENSREKNVKAFLFLYVYLHGHTDGMEGIEATFQGFCVFHS